MRTTLQLLLMTLMMAFPAKSAEPRIPIIHTTDLCHPHDDPDDHYDLACLFAMPEFDIRGIVLDLGEHQASRPGRPAIEQMLHITARKVPYAVGLNRPLRSRNDQAMDEDLRFQGGIQLILALLRASSEKVVIHTTGSCRDVAAAFNREQDLFRTKVKAVYIEAGNGPDGKQDEYNVSIGPHSYLRLLESGLPVYWCPCFGRDGYQTFYKIDQAEVVGACTQEVRNYFVYCLSKSKEDPLTFLTAGPKPVPGGPRNMWCTAPMLHAAGRNVYQRGNDDFVALTPREAAKNGLTSKLVDAFEFVPVRLSVDNQPASDAQGTKPPPPIVNMRWDNPQTATYLFHSHEPHYERIMARCLKNLLAELGR